MEETFLDDELTAEARARKRALLAFFRKVLWTLLVLGGILALLLPLTISFHWEKVALSCLLGFLNGIALAAGISVSPRNRTWITLLLGVLILPGLAVYVSFLAGSDPQAFDATSSVLIPFLSYALASLIGAIIMVNIWQRAPTREKEATVKEPAQGATPGTKERTSHEGSSLQRVA